MKRLLKKIMAFALAGIMAISVLGISAFATSTSGKITISDDVAAFGFGKANTVALTKGGTSTGAYIYAEKDGDTAVQLKTSAQYDKLSVTDKALQLQEALNKVGSLGLSSTSLAIVEKWAKTLGATEAELLTSLFANTKADLFTAMKWFSPFRVTLGLILGIGVIFIIVLLIASTVFDLVYIGLPMARNVMDGKAEQKGKARPFGVSTDAVRVVENEDNNKGTGGNMYVAYFKKRVVTYIILAVCILYLINGQLSSVIGWLLDQVSGVGS